jgi:hypothetical protein
MDNHPRTQEIQQDGLNYMLTLLIQQKKREREELSKSQQPDKKKMKPRTMKQIEQQHEDENTATLMFAAGCLVTVTTAMRTFTTDCDVQLYCIEILRMLSAENYDAVASAGAFPLISAALTLQSTTTADDSSLSRMKAAMLIEQSALRALSELIVFDQSHKDTFKLLVTSGGAEAAIKCMLRRSTKCDADRIMPRADMRLQEDGITLLLQCMKTRLSDRFSANTKKTLDKLTIELLNVGAIEAIKAAQQRYYHEMEKGFMDKAPAAECLRLLRICALWGSRDTPHTHKGVRKDKNGVRRKKQPFCMCAACWNAREKRVPAAGMKLGNPEHVKNALRGVCERRQLVVLPPLLTNSSVPNSEGSNSQRSFDIVAGSWT